ncbi:MAG: rhomboid family intramembrane serine protease [Pirellulales bacterium]|nr:rhomboid family intramembrane serine protease [Pirellulales bacterium]
MGIHDRDYYRPEQPAFSIRAPRSMVGILILINVAVYLVSAFTPAQKAPLGGNIVGYWLTDHLAVSAATLTHPLYWWQFLTYGFAHAASPGHVLFNMLALWFLGRDVEDLLGRKEFLQLYLVLLVVGSVSWAIVNKLTGAPASPEIRMLGASGAVAGIVVLFALNFPRRMLLLFFVLPVPAWVVGVMVVVGDVLGATGSTGPGHVAYGVHLAGAAFAFAYFQFGWKLSRLTEGRFRWSGFKRRPRLRVHNPRREETDLAREVDRILEKIHNQGESSLSRKERRVLETASREYQKRRRE